MRQLLIVISLLLSPLAFAQDITLPWDTAYIDEQAEIDNLAERLNGSGRSFRGPGPYTVHFEAEVPADATYYVWQFARDAGFSDIIVLYRDLNTDFTFSETGTFYARFGIGDSQDDNLVSYSDPYTFQVTESLLDVPNLITPDSPSGANQVFKVKYKSLKTFEMWVYNRWGNQFFHTTDPTKGWNGKHNGRTVPTGAYYYTIKATGTDGIKYNKKGDINVLGTRNTGSSGSSSE